MRFFLSLLLCVGVAAHAQPDRSANRPFFKDSRGELALFRARRDTAVTLVIATKLGQTPAVVRRLEALGAAIKYRNDTVGYLRARVPIDKAETVAATEGVVATQISFMIVANGGIMRRAYLSAQNGQSHAPQFENSFPFSRDSVPWPPQLTDYPLRHPYSALADLGALEFRKSHPTWDGRGVTIADIEYPPDMLSPEMQEARSLDGTVVRKLVDVLTAADPDEPDDLSGSIWFRMRDSVRAAGGTFAFKGRTYTAPKDGNFRIAIGNKRVWYPVLYEKEIQEMFGGKAGSDSLFAILWDQSTNTVWVDTDQNLSFTDNRALTDYAIRGDIGEFGTDDPKTAIRETIAFVVQTNPAKRAVALSLGVGTHTTPVMNAAAGSKGKSGLTEGIAPGARLVSINYGQGSAQGFAESLIMAFSDPRIDIILLEQTVFVVEQVFWLRDGSSVPSIICARLIKHYKKPFLVPGSNRPGYAQVSEHAAAAGAIGVGAYQSATSYLVNGGIRAASKDNLHYVGSGGPAGNGAVKPDILSPSNVISAQVRFTAGEGAPGLYWLPPGYAVFGGTSTATPVAAGSIALLVSAARQSNIPVDAERIRRALFSSARYLERIPAYEQGHGLIQVGAAFEALQRMAKEDAAPEISVRAPVRTVVSGWYPVPNEGEGLFQVEGIKVGDRLPRMITLTRTNGPKNPVDLAIRMIGNDGTFSAPDRVTLPLGQPTTLSVTAAPTTVGVHSALLQLFDPSSGTLVKSVSLSVGVGNAFTAPTFQSSVDDSLPRPGRKSVFYAIPAGVDAVALSLTATKRALGFTFIKPDGRGIMNSLAATQNGTFLQIAPEPGFWQADMSDGRRPAQIKDDQPFEGTLPATPFTLKASLIATRVESPSRVQGAGGLSIRVRNLMAAFEGAVMTLPLASGRSTRETIGPREQRIYTVEVPAGSTALMTRVSGASDPGADIDLYVFDCTGARCMASATDGNTTPNETVRIANPKAGIWKIVVDAARLQNGSISFDYIDLVLNPRFGTLSSTDFPSQRTSGATWDVKANVWRADDVGSGRRTFAVVGISHPNAGTLPISWTALSIE
jgi:hypothetical protein